jgi:hypothetical protein
MLFVIGLWTFLRAVSIGSATIALLADMDQWMREGDVVRRKTLLREVYREIRLWPKTGRKPWTREVLVAASGEALTRFGVVSPRRFEPGRPG